jgi:hypothetical protein
MRFSSDDAFQASMDGDPIILTALQAAKICRDHDVDYADYVSDAAWPKLSPLGDVDAAYLLGWLGY